MSTSETKHTPGPWKTVARRNRRNPRLVDHVEIQDADGFRVMVVGADDTAQSDASIHEVVSKRGQANARLVAAAPDLLAVVRKAFENEDAAIRGQPLPHGVLLLAQEMRAVIAKAEGK